MEENCFLYRTTLACAQNQCIPCFYKIFPSGYAYLKTKSKKRKFSEESKVKLPPNQRPENCLRSKSSAYAAVYRSSDRVLTLGDGDLSFALSLAHEFSSSAQTALNLIATTYESHESLVNTYPDISARMQEIADTDAFLYHDVDATKLESYRFLANKKFNFVLWNFPCIGVRNGLDGQVSELDQNKALIKDFFESVRPFLESTGEVHLTHKTVEPFSWWNIEQLAMESGFRLVFKIVFDK
jgi:25S rRNA (uracil2634-N3)-methyltransferase